MTTSQKGVVMEVRGREVVALTPDGAFRKIGVSGEPPQVGEEITLTPSRVMPAGRWGLAAVAAVTLVLVSSLVFRAMLMPPVAVAFVTLDINPSVELALDRSERVISVNALNDDGGGVLQALDLRGIPAEQAVAEITAEAVRQGFIQPAGENTVLITYTPVKAGAKPREDLVERMQSSAGMVLEKGQLRGEVQTVHGSVEMREKASEVGLSTGKYAIWLEAVEEGLDLTPADLQASSVAKAIRASGGNVGQLIGKAHAEDDYRELEEKVREKIRGKERQDEKTDRGNKDQGKEDVPRGNVSEEKSMDEDDDDREDQENKRRELENAREKPRDVKLKEKLQGKERPRDQGKDEDEVEADQPGKRQEPAEAPEDNKDRLRNNLGSNGYKDLEKTQKDDRDDQMDDLRQYSDGAREAERPEDDEEHK